MQSPFVNEKLLKQEKKRKKWEVIKPTYKLVTKWVELGERFKFKAYDII